MKKKKVNGNGNGHLVRSVAMKQKKYFYLKYMTLYLN